MSNWKLIMVLCLGGFQMLLGQQAQFEAGNKAYREGDYSEAILQYESLLQSGWENATLYYNLGNAQYKKARLGEAVWAYEKALQLAPAHQDAAANRQLVQTLLVDEIEAVPMPLVERYFRLWADGLGRNGFRWLSISWLWIIAAAWSFWRIKKSRWSVLTMAAALFLLLVSVLSWGIYERLTAGEQKAVIIVENVYVKTAPSDAAPDAFVLHEGTMVQLETVLEDWQEIRIADGQVGWLHPNALKNL